MPKRKTTTTPGAAPQVDDTKQVTPKQHRVTRLSASAGKAKEQAVATGRSRRTEVRINYRDFSRTGSRSPLKRPSTPHPKKAGKAKRSVSPSRKTKASKERRGVHHKALSVPTAMGKTELLFCMGLACAALVAWMVYLKFAR